MVKVVIVMIKIFVKVPSIVCIIDPCQPYQMCPSVPSDDGVIRRCIKTDAAINPANLVGPLLDRNGRSVRMNTSIVTKLGSNMVIGFSLPLYWLKLAVEDIVSMDCLLRRGEGENVEGGNGGRPFLGCMGM